MQTCTESIVRRQPEQSTRGAATVRRNGRQAADELQSSLIRMTGTG